MARQIVGRALQGVGHAAHMTLVMMNAAKRVVKHHALSSLVTATLSMAESKAKKLALGRLISWTRR